MKTSITIALVLMCFNLSAQTEKYTVVSEVLNVRSGPGTQFEVVHKLTAGDEVEVIEKNQNGWWQIQYSDIFGYVSAKYLKRDQYADWQKRTYSSGTTPDCENVTPEYDNNLDNHLKIQVGSNTDVVVKMMRKTTYGDKCIRVVYVNSGDTYYMKNIPEGVYYLKIAYGKDYRQSIVDGKCYIKFVKSAQYEKGKDVMDFNVIKTAQGTSIPYFELFLDVITTTRANEFKSGNISEAEFNH